MELRIVAAVAGNILRIGELKPVAGATIAGATVTGNILRIGELKRDEICYHSSIKPVISYALAN